MKKQLIYFFTWFALVSSLSTRTALAQFQSNTSPATDEALRAKRKQGLGMCAGPISGIGVGYWHTAGNTWEYLICGLAGRGTERVFGSLGIEFKYLLPTESKISRFYMPMGAALLAHGPATDLTTQLLTGTGLGLNLYGSDQALIGIELPLTLILEVKKGSLEFKGIYPIPGVAVIFYL